MGWTETYYQFKLSHKQRREEMDKLFTWESADYSHCVLRSSITNNVYYAAVEDTEKSTGKKDVWAAVCLISERKDGYGYWYGYKDMDETCGPYSYDCPLAILKLLSPTENEYANEWRRKCYEKHKKPSLSSMPEGSSIRFICPYKTTYHEAGESITLTKTVTCRYWSTNGKHRTTYRWLEPNGRIYWKTTMIPDDFEVA